MGLKEEGQAIDSALQEQWKKWVSDIRTIEDELSSLESVIKTAASFGDLSENTEYTSAVDRKQMLLKNKGDLEEKVRLCKTKFETYATKDSSRGELIQVGSVVRILYEEIGKRLTIKVVPQKSDAPQKHAVSTSSPLGRALLNKKAGDRTVVNTERRKWICVIEEVY